MKSRKILTVFFGVTISLFGFLKFVSSFKEWYKAQIVTSGLPQFVNPMGIVVEIATGIAFLLPFVLSMDDRAKRFLLTVANYSMISIMIVATFVHLVPQVPSDVLPLKIKLPVIPLMFMAMAIFNLAGIRKIRFK